MAERMVLLDVEEGLKGDFNGTYKKQLEEEIFNGLNDLRQAMDAGMDGDEFAQADKFKGSLEAANEAVDKVWNLMNK